MTWLDGLTVVMLLVALGLCSPKLRAAARGWTIMLLIAASLALIVYGAVT